MQPEYDNPDSDIHDLDSMLYARHNEIESFKDLTEQRGTNIPALFSTFYKFIHNPSSVSVETYKRMVDTDDTIGSGVDFLTTCLAARLGKYQHPNPEITDWVRKALDGIKGGWSNTVKQMLSASWAGFSVAEKVWKNCEDGFVPERICVLPPSTILFEADRVGEITADGILQYQRNWNPLSLGMGIGYFGGAMSIGMGFMSASASPDPFAKFGDLPFPMRTANSYNYLCIRIPKQKCIHISFDAQGNFGNPYGRSLLRRLYKWWVIKDAAIRMMSVALDRKGTPLTIVYASQHATLVDPKKTSVANNRGDRNVSIRADQAAKQAFEHIHNDTTIILPGKKGEIFDTDFVPQDAHADQFIMAIDTCNKSFLRALLIPALIFGNGDGTGSYALGQEHSKTFVQTLDGILEGIQEAIKEQLIKEMLTYNFPKEAWNNDLGSFGTRDFSQEEQDKIMVMFEKAINNGIVDPTDLEDLNKMRGVIGFSERKAPEQTTSTDGIPENASGEMSGIGSENKADLEDLALNGAQVTALLDVISRVNIGEVPPSSAIEIIHAAFPLINLDTIKRIIAPIKVNKVAENTKQEVIPGKEKTDGNDGTDQPTN
jgi:hypothetical protein